MFRRKLVQNLVLRGQAMKHEQIYRELAEKLIKAGSFASDTEV